MKKQNETSISYTDTTTKDGVFCRIVTAPEFDFILVDGDKRHDFMRIYINDVRPKLVGLVHRLPDMDFVNAVLEQSGWDYKKYPRVALFVNGTKPTRQEKRKTARKISHLRKLD